MSQLANLVVRPATYEQWQKTHEYQYLHWGGGLSLEQFSKREHRLCLESDFGRNNFHRWVLVPEQNPETLDFLCSCESYTRPIYLKETANTSPKEAVCHSICSVFTPEQNRQKGYAQRMMSLLHDELAKDAVLSVLYSDVGDFYSKAKRSTPLAEKALGWRIISPHQVVWAVEDSVPVTPKLQARPLQESEFEAVCKADAAMLQNEVAASQATAFSIVPTADQLHWLTERCKFYDNVRFPADREQYPHIDNWGSQIGEISTKDWAFAVWSYDVIKKELTILRLRCSAQEQLQSLVSAAQEAAKSQGMKTITAWNLDAELAKGCGWNNVERASSLPALAWYGEGEAPNKWLANEHWAWC